MIALEFVSHLGWTYVLSLARKDWRGAWKEFLFFGILPDLAFAVPMLLLFLPSAVGMAAASFEVPEFYSVAEIYRLSHSYLTAFFAFAVVFLVLRRFYWPMLGWFLHISMDVFTHKGSMAMQMPFYPLPFSVEGFVYWSNTLFMLASWTAMALVLLWYYTRRPRRSGRARYNKKRGSK
jgi:hypothetical protein